MSVNRRLPIPSKWLTKETTLAVLVSLSLQYRDRNTYYFPQQHLTTLILNLHHSIKLLFQNSANATRRMRTVRKKEGHNSSGGNWEMGVSTVFCHYQHCQKWWWWWWWVFLLFAVVITTNGLHTNPLFSHRSFSKPLWMDWPIEDSMRST